MAARVAFLAFVLAAAQDPAPKADDVEFLSRLAQDLTGEPPTEAELKAFAADPDPGKRTKRIDQLLESYRFADFWARRFSEVLVGDPKDVKPTWVFDLAPGAAARIAKEFEAWMRDQIQKDRLWTEIVADIVNARGKSEQNPAVGYHLALHRGEGHAQEFAEASARHFLGIRLNCARCHDHPFDLWTVEHYYGLAAFVARQRMKSYGTAGNIEHVALTYAEKGEAYIKGTEIDSDFVKKSKSGGMAKPVFLFGGQAAAGDGVDRAAALAELMTSKSNTQLSKALVNRVWGWLFGRGIVDPVDDFSQRNRPAIGGVLDTVVADFAANKYSLKYLVKSLCTSARYQQAGGWKKEMEQASFKAASWRTRALAPKPMKDPPPPKVTMTVPDSWIRVGHFQVFHVPHTIGASAHYFVADKAKKAGPAVFRFGEVKRGAKTVEDNLQEWSLRMPGRQPKPKPEALRATFPTMLYDVSGGFTCEPGVPGPVPYRILLATIQFAGSPWFFELAGPTETVNGWREEFLSLLKTAFK